MKQQLIFGALLFFSVSMQAKNKIRKVNRCSYAVNYLQEIKYKGYQFDASCRMKNKNILGISMSHAFKKIPVPSCLRSKIYADDTAQYKVLKILDITYGKYISISKTDNTMLYFIGGLSYSNFQGKINFLPFNCNLIYDTEITEAIGASLSSVLHANTRNKFGMYVKTYANFNLEKIIFGIGVGVRFGKMVE